MPLRWLAPLPLIAILRGIRPQEVVAIGRALSGAGFRILEVPLNSPDPIESIRLLAHALDASHLVGAGTVRTPRQVVEVAKAGGRLIVTPHADTHVIEAARKAGLVAIPGVATPTEAFAALDARANALKIFPAGQLGPSGLRAWRAVLPDDVPMLPVGGIDTDNMAPWIAAGANGFGIGSALYAPGMDAGDVAHRGSAFVAAWQSAAAENMHP